MYLYHPWLHTVWRVEPGSSDKHAHIRTIPFVGVDLGVKALAGDSDGEVFEHQKQLTNALNEAGISKVNEAYF